MFKEVMNHFVLSYAVPISESPNDVSICFRFLWGRCCSEVFAQKGITACKAGVSAGGPGCFFRGDKRPVALPSSFFMFLKGRKPIFGVRLPRALWFLFFISTS